MAGAGDRETGEEEKVVLEEEGIKYRGTMEKMNLWQNVAERLNAGPRTAGQLPCSQLDRNSQMRRSLMSQFWVGFSLFLSEEPVHWSSKVCLYVYVCTCVYLVHLRQHMGSSEAIAVSVSGILCQNFLALSKRASAIS